MFLREPLTPPSTSSRGGTRVGVRSVRIHHEGKVSTDTVGLNWTVIRPGLGRTQRTQREIETRSEFGQVVGRTQTKKKTYYPYRQDRGRPSRPIRYYFVYTCGPTSQNYSWFPGLPSEGKPQEVFDDKCLFRNNSKNFCLYHFF